MFDGDAADAPAEPAAEEKTNEKALTPHLESVRDGLRDHLGCPVEIKLTGREAGRMILSFADNAEFEGLLRRLRAA